MQIPLHQPAPQMYRSPQKINYNPFSVSPSPSRKISYAKNSSSIYNSPKKNNNIYNSPQPVKYNQYINNSANAQKNKHIFNSQQPQKIIRVPNQKLSQLKQIQIPKSSENDMKISVRQNSPSSLKPIIERPSIGPTNTVKKIAPPITLKSKKLPEIKTKEEVKPPIFVKPINIKTVKNIVDPKVKTAPVINTENGEIPKEFLKNSNINNSINIPENDINSNVIIENSPEKINYLNRTPVKKNIPIKSSYINGYQPVTPSIKLHNPGFNSSVVMSKSPTRLQKNVLINRSIYSNKPTLYNSYITPIKAGGKMNLKHYRAPLLTEGEQNRMVKKSIISNRSILNNGSILNNRSVINNGSIGKNRSILNNGSILNNSSVINNKSIYLGSPKGSLIRSIKGNSSIRVQPEYDLS